MSCQFLNRSGSCATHGEVATERVPQNMDPNVAKSRLTSGSLHEPLRETLPEGSPVFRAEHPKTLGDHARLWGKQIGKSLDSRRGES